MSEGSTKKVIIVVKELVLAAKIGKDQHADDLLRFLAEQLPQIEATRDGNEIEIVMPIKMAKKTLKLRLKKFLHQKNLYNEFRPILYRTSEIDGYLIKRRKILELSYY